MIYRFLALVESWRPLLGMLDGAWWTGRVEQGERAVHPVAPRTKLKRCQKWLLCLMRGLSSACRSVVVFADMWSVLPRARECG